MSKRPTDKERLNWLTLKAWGVEFNTNQSLNGKWLCDVGGGGNGLGETPRQAIDAAILAERKARRKP